MCHGWADQRREEGRAPPVRAPCTARQRLGRCCTEWSSRPSFSQGGASLGGAVVARAVREQPRVCRSVMAAGREGGGERERRPAAKRAGVWNGSSRLHYNRTILTSFAALVGGPTVGPSARAAYICEASTHGRRRGTASSMPPTTARGWAPTLGVTRAPVAKSLCHRVLRMGLQQRGLAAVSAGVPQERERRAPAQARWLRRSVMRRAPVSRGRRAGAAAASLGRPSHIQLLPLLSLLRVTRPCAHRAARDGARRAGAGVCTASAARATPRAAPARVCGRRTLDVNLCWPWGPVAAAPTARPGPALSPQRHGVV